MDNQYRSGIYSWPMIILFLLFFWPIGLYLIIKRYSSDKAAAVASGGRGLKIFGIILLVFSGFGILGSLDPFDGGSIVIFLFFIAGGVVMLRKAKKIKKEGESIKRYLAMIVNNNVRQLDEIAAATGKPYNVVKSEVQKMIDKGFLKNAYINESERSVVVAGSNPVNTSVNTNMEFQRQMPFAAAPVQPRVVACSCCGANNTITGENGECEYCGSPLK
jgi:hypothetical protein